MIVDPVALTAAGGTGRVFAELVERDPEGTAAMTAVLDTFTPEGWEARRALAAMRAGIVAYAQGDDRRGIVDAMTEALVKVVVQENRAQRRAKGTRKP